MDLRRLIAIARTWLPLMVVAAVLAGAAAFVVSSSPGEGLRGEDDADRRPGAVGCEPGHSQLIVAQNLAATYAAVATTRPIMESLIEELSLDVSPGALADRVQVEAPETARCSSSPPRTPIRLAPRRSRTRWADS